MSPLLFAIAIKPLAIVQRSDPRRTGRFRDNREFCFLLMICMYRIHTCYSSFFLNSAAPENPLHNLPFKVTNLSSYLGIYITENLNIARPVQQWNFFKSFQQLVEKII